MDQEAFVALFFDAGWFDARLEARGLTRDILAAACGLSADDLALVFKDQRELSAAEVARFAEMLGCDPAEIADHAGVATPGRVADPLEARLRRLEARIAALEAAAGADET
jgi:transcriptional regulator with XRE-family HTH domain